MGTLSRIMYGAGVAGMSVAWNISASTDSITIAPAVIGGLFGAVMALGATGFND